MYSICVLWVQCICILAVYCGTVTMYSSSVLWAGVGSITHNYINYNYNYISIFSSITITITLIFFQFNYNYNYTVSISITITITLCGTKYIQHLLII